MTLSNDTANAVSGIADAVDPALLAGTYHEAVGAVINLQCQLCVAKGKPDRSQISFQEVTKD